MWVSLVCLSSKINANYFGTWPTPAVIIVAILVLYIKALTSSLFVYKVIIVSFDMRVNNSHHLPSFGGNLVNHIHWVCKLMHIPSKIPKCSNLVNIILICWWWDQEPFGMINVVTDYKMPPYCRIYLTR